MMMLMIKLYFHRVAPSAIPEEHVYEWPPILLHPCNLVSR